MSNFTTATINSTNNSTTNSAEKLAATAAEKPSLLAYMTPVELRAIVEQLCEVSYDNAAKDVPGVEEYILEAFRLWANLDKEGAKMFLLGTICHSAGGPPDDWNVIVAMAGMVMD